MGFGRMENEGCYENLRIVWPLKREEPVKYGFHRRVMKKSLLFKQVLELFLFMSLL